MSMKYLNLTVPIARRALRLGEAVEPGLEQHRLQPVVEDVPRPGERGSSAQPTISSVCRSPCRPSAMPDPRVVTAATNQLNPISSTRF
jgi:hypothetical protein